MRRAITFLRVSAAVCAALLAPVLGGCVIFDLKDPAGPSTEGATDDPLNIVDILKAVNPNVSTGMNYDYYLTDNVEFEDYQLVTIRGRAVIQMLERLRSRSSQSSPLNIEWRITTYGYHDGNLYYLNDVQYVIYLNGAPTYSGTAYFRILGDKISYWKDVPDGASPIFFEQ